MAIRAGGLRCLAVALAVVSMRLMPAEVNGCSLTGRPRVYSMEQTLQMAPVVVLAIDTHHNVTSNVATLDVLCVFKGNVSRTARLDGGPMITSCEVSEIEVGGRYIFSLEMDDDENMYDYFAPAALNPTAFEATPENLQLVARLCEMRHPAASLGINASACPTVTEPFTCVDVLNTSAGTCRTSPIVIVALMVAIARLIVTRST